MLVIKTRKYNTVITRYPCKLMCVYMFMISGADLKVVSPLKLEKRLLYTEVNYL